MKSNNLFGCTVVTVVKNGASSILKTLDSVKQQSYQDIEHIIIDGCSSDGTREIVDSFDNSKIRMYSDNDNGIYQAINKGILKSKNTIICLLHCDDEFENNDVIKEAMELLDENGADYLFGGVKFIGGNRKVLRKWIPGPITKYSLASGYMFPHTTLFCKREVFNHIGLYNENYKISGDYEFIIRLIKSNYKGCMINKYLILMAVGGASNNSVKNILYKCFEDFCVLKENRTGGFYTVIFKRIRKIHQIFGFK